MVWSGAVVGIAIVLGWHGIPKPLRASLYVLLGWFIFPVVPQLRAVMGDAAVWMLFVGGAFYTVGAVIYATRRPDPFPRVFGFHEIFHLLVVAAAVCHYLVVDAAIHAIG
jgi:hemolysin III